MCGSSPAKFLLVIFHLEVFSFSCFFLLKISPCSVTAPTVQKFEIWNLRTLTLSVSSQPVYDTRLKSKIQLLQTTANPTAEVCYWWKHWRVSPLVESILCGNQIFQILDCIHTVDDLRISTNTWFYNRSFRISSFLSFSLSVLLVKKTNETDIETGIDICLSVESEETGSEPVILDVLTVFGNWFKKTAADIADISDSCNKSEVRFTD